MNYFNTLLFILLILIAGCVNSPRSPDTFSPKQVKEDVNLMLDKMEDIHPNLYAYTSKEEIQQHKKGLFKTINKPISRKEFCRLFMPLVSSLGDGHTSLYTPEQDILTYTAMGGLFFPVSIYVKENSLWVKHCPDQSIPPDSRILSVDNHLANDILALFRHYVSGEKTIHRDGLLTYYFPVLYWINYNYGNVFKIEYLPPDQPTPVITEINAMPFENLDDQNKSLMDTAFYEYHQLNENTGIIDFKSFSDLERFQQFLEKIFSEIKSSALQNLIIDIRNNGGGNSSLGDELFNYITDKPYSQIEKMQIKLSKEILDKGWGDWLPKDTLDKYKGEIYTIYGEPEEPENNEFLFDGDVYLLTSSKSFSSANMFASAFKCYEMGTIVGEETGGLTVCYGDIISLELPYTKLKCGVSYKKFYEACGEENGRGVIPDFEVKSLPTDTTDMALQFTLELIEKQDE